MSIFKRFALGAERWHHRVLGILWAWFGAALLLNMVLGSFWWQPITPLLSIVLAVSYLVAGSALCLQISWSRLCMLPLLILSSYIWFYAWANEPWDTDADPANGSIALAGLAFGIYSFLFVLWSLWFNFESYLQMSLFRRFALGAERWHYRVLGGIWTCFGVALIWNIVLGNLWWQFMAPLLAIMLAVSYLVAGPAFCLQALWSRWLMLPLVALSACLCFYTWANEPWDADPANGRIALAGLAFWIYSLWFVIWSLIRIEII